MVADRYKPIFLALFVTLNIIGWKEMKNEISQGVVHKVPEDMRNALTSSPEVLAAWEDITPIARNEFICWVEEAKKPETRNHRIQRTRDELLEGKRRPCCWAGCPHR
jgi:uncharacterized protein YdeI (YjbR/CyaY-like superfamily)